MQGIYSKLKAYSRHTLGGWIYEDGTAGVLWEVERPKKG